MEYSQPHISCQQKQNQSHNLLPPKLTTSCHRPARNLARPTLHPFPTPPTSPQLLPTHNQLPKWLPRSCSSTPEKNLHTTSKHRNLPSRLAHLHPSEQKNYTSPFDYSLSTTLSTSLGTWALEDPGDDITHSTPTYFHNFQNFGSRQACLDRILCTQSLLPFLSAPRAPTNPLLSDHAPIETRLSFTPRSPPRWRLDPLLLNPKNPEFQQVKYLAQTLSQATSLASWLCLKEAIIPHLQEIQSRFRRRQHFREKNLITTLTVAQTIHNANPTPPSSTLSMPNSP